MKKSYELKYGWSYIGSDYVYTEYKIFSNKEERDKYLFNILCNYYLKIRWYKKIDIEDWKTQDRDYY